MSQCQLCSSNNLLIIIDKFWESVETTPHILFICQDCGAHALMTELEKEDEIEKEILEEYRNMENMKDAIRASNFAAELIANIRQQ